MFFVRLHLVRVDERKEGWKMSFSLDTEISDGKSKTSGRNCKPEPATWISSKGKSRNAESIKSHWLLRHFCSWKVLPSVFPSPRRKPHALVLVKNPKLRTTTTTPARRRVKVSQHATPRAISPLNIEPKGRGKVSTGCACVGGFGGVGWKKEDEKRGICAILRSRGAGGRVRQSPTESHSIASLFPRSSCIFR